MEETQDIAPSIEDQQGTPQQVGPAEKYYNYLKKAGADAPPTFDSFKKTLSDPKSAQQYYNYLRDKKFDAPPTFDSFSKTLGVSPSTPQTLSTPNQVQPPAPPEHEIQHTSVHDIRHLQEMSNLPIRNESTAMGGLAGSASSYTYSQADADRNKAYKGQYESKAQELGKEWGVDAEAIKKTLTDFPDEPDENKLKNFAVASKQNPVIYSRLKDANDIRMAIVKSGNGGVNDANAFNHLQQADDYHELVDYNIPLQKEIMAKHNLGPQFLEKLKNTQAPLINILDPDLLAKYWNSQDKELGLSPSQYAGLETERLFSPNKYQMDLNIIKQSRGIGEDGKATPKDMSKESYEYQRGVENVLYNLDRQGRENTARYISGQKPQIEAQVNDLQNLYQTKINNAKTKDERTQLISEFNSNPLIQEATKLEQGQDELKYADVNDQRIYPLNFSDQATRAVRDAMDLDKDSMFNVKDLSAILQGAGESSDNTIRWIKNMAINIAGSDEQKSFNNAKNIGHQSLTELSAYVPRSYTGVESPFKIPDNLTKDVKSVFNDSSLSNAEKEQKAIALVRDNFDQLEVNPKAGQQNLTGKSAIYQASNVMGQILGIANQSFLLGGAIGDASKLQQMATAFTPMFMSTQNQMYEQALKNGDEHPLLKSNLDATIISLASLINPDIKVVRGMMGAESGLGKMIAGISDDTWNKVLSENKPIVDRALGVAKATGKQMGLANLQYGLIVPTAEAISHKAIFNEDSNLGDKIKDAVIQTSITMALPAILHGAWGGMKAKDVNPTQKYAIVEAGLHPDLNIELIEGRIKAGEISEIQGHEMKQMVKHAGEILQNAEMIKTDGTPMNEKEVADTVYNMLRVRTLEGKLKNAAGPVKPIIEERIHELNKDIADLHTSEESKQKTELNQLLHDNLDRIREKMPTMEDPIKDAIARNEPEEVYREIASQAQETTKVDGVEKSSRSLTEEIFGKALVDKAIEISKKKPEPIPKEESVNEKPTEGAETNNAEVSGAASSISVVRPGELKKPETITIKPQDNASAIRSDQGQGSTTGNELGRGQNEGGENIPVNPKETPGNANPEQPTGQQPGEATGKEIDEDWPFVDEPNDSKFTSTRNAITEQKVAEAGLIPAMKEAAREFGTVWKDAQQKIKKGADVSKLVDALKKKPRAVTDTENAMILYHQNIKEAQLDAINKEMTEAYEKGDYAKVDENRLLRASLLDDLQDIYDVDRAIGRETARGLNARKMTTDRRFSLINMQMDKRAAKDGKPLTEQEQTDVEKTYNDIREANAAYEKRVTELEAENKALKVVKEEKATTGKTKKTNAEYSKERKDIIQRMRDDLLKAAKGGEGLTSSIPLAAQLKAVAPHIPDLLKSYISQGIDKLDGITAGMYAQLKPLIPELTESHVHDLIAGEFTDPKIKEEPKEPSKATQIKNEAKQQKYVFNDPEAMKLKAQYEREKESWGDDLRKAELSKRTNLEKAQDAFIKWERAFKLSGITTLAKLGMAAVTRLTTTPIEEGVGAIYSKALPGISSKATGEGGINVKAEAKALTSAFTQGMKDSYNIMSKSKRGKSDIESIFGKKGELPPEAIGFFGQLHSAIKAPIKRAAFERSMTKRIAANLRNGIDVSDPMVQSKIALQAYKDANRAIFMQDNFVSEKYRSFVNSLEKSKTYPELSKGAATLMQWLIPFVKVPTNIVGEVGTHTAGLPIAAGKIVYNVFGKGLKNISEDEADMIMRNLKKGSLGAAALLLGYFNPSNFGGYYQKGEKRSDDDAKAGGMKLFGHKIPIFLLESPIFQTMQLGATIRRVSDTKLNDVPKGVTQGTIAAVLGLAEHEPLIDQPARIMEAIKDPREREYFIDELIRGTLEPAVLNNLAEGLEYMDKGDVKHKPETLTDHLEMGIPGLRQQVPLKGEKGSGGGGGAGGSYGRKPAHK